MLSLLISSFLYIKPIEPLIKLKEIKENYTKFNKGF